MSFAWITRCVRSLAGAVVVMGAAVAHAGTIYVATGGDDVSGDGSSSNPFKTIEKGLSVAYDGDRVEIGEGTFETVSEILFVTNGITVAGQGAGKTFVKAVFASGTVKNNGQIYRRCFLVDNDNAVLRDLTMFNAYWYAWGTCTRTYMTDGQVGGELILKRGLVTDCVITGTKHGNSTGDGCGSKGGGAYVMGGVLTNCVIHGCKSVYNNTGVGNGGGLGMSGGLVVDCVITNNYAGGNGAGVYISGGTLRNTLISRNSPVSTGSGNGAVFIDGNALLENCVISNNSSLAYGGVYINNTSGKIRNSLVVNNAGKYRGSGIYSKGTVQNCTIANCTASMENDKGPGLYLADSKAVAVNNIITDCGGGVYGDVGIASGSFKTNMTDRVAPGSVPGDGNVFGKVVFASAANGDYRLTVGCLGIDSAHALDVVTTDIVGRPRPVGSAPDMGCYEYVPGSALACFFNVSSAELAVGGDVTVQSVVEAASGALTYKWYVDGAVVADATGPVFVYEGVAVGSHVIRLEVSDGNSSAAYERIAAVTGLPSKTYVDLNGSDTYPYETKAKAAHVVQDAINACYCTTAHPGEVQVASGIYQVGAMWNIINKPLKLVSEDGPATTHLCASNPGASSYDGQQIRRVLFVNHPQAYVSGFTVSNGWWYSAAGDSGPGGMRLDSGTVTNCVFARNRGGDCGGAIQMSGGLVTHCEIFDNYSRYNNDGCNTRGGGVYMTGGTTECCRIYRNWAANNGDTGSGVWMSGGSLRDCEIFGNFSKANGMKGIGLCITGGLAERCVITNNNQSARMSYPSGNSSVAYSAGGVYQKGGTVRNCLVAGNRSQQSGTGYRQEGGVCEFNTITANSSDNKSNSGLYIDSASAIARFNVLYGNGAGMDAEPDCNLKFVKASSLATNIIGHASQGGIGNIYDDPLFVNAVIGDYTLGAGSPAIDVASVVPGVTMDIAGNARPKDGDGDGIELPDAGCYEAADASEGPLSCAFSPTEASGHDELTVTFTASAAGSGSTGDLDYDWDVGDGVIEGTENSPTITVKFSTYGVHAVSLEVTAANEGKASKTIVDCVKVGTARVFVDAASANPAWPYATAATAATNLEEAVNTAVRVAGARSEYVLAEGDYRLSGKWLILNTPTWLHGSGDRTMTRIVASPALSANRASKILCIGNEDVVVEGITMMGGRWEGNSNGDSGGAVRVGAGTLRNCILVDNQGGNEGGQLDMSGGVVSDVVISNGQCMANGNVGNGQGAVYMTGGILKNSVVVGNVGQNSAGGVFISGGMVSNCVIRGNRSGYNGCNNRPAGGVYITGGLLTHCVVAGNYSYGNHGGIYQNGGRVCNCLIEGNWSPATAYQGVGIANGDFINNTVVTNGFGGSAASPVVTSISGGSIANSIFASNANDDISASGGTVSHSLYANASGSGCKTGDPLFRNPGRGDWRICKASPCRNSGDLSVWGGASAVGGMVDLAARPRLFGLAIDMGCYENNSSGMSLNLR